MKRKSLSTIILLLFIIPSLVLAKDTCNDNEIKIKSITLKELSGFSEEMQESSINNNTINLNLKMYDVGDSSTYDITVENTSNEDYYFTKDSMKLENDYLEYSLKNDSEVIPAKKEKAIELKVSYKNKIPNESYSDTNKLSITLSDRPLENPKTKMTYTFIFIIISLMAITIYTKINNKSFSRKKILLVISLLSIIPITTTALCTVNLNVETKIEIENKEAIFLPGTEVNIKMKELAGDDTSTLSDKAAFQDEAITAIKHSESAPPESNKEDKNIVSTADSPYPIYMWYENNTIYWWSEDIHPSLNNNSLCLFYNLKNLNDISSVSLFDTSSVRNMQAMFYNTSISSLSPIENWDTTSLEILRYTFSNMKLLANVKPLSKWNTSKVKNMNNTFSYDSNLISLKGLEGWDTSNVNKMSYTFSYDSNLISLKGLENWDTSNVTTMEGMFYRDKALKSIVELKNWNVSKVKDMGFMFLSCYQLEEINLSNWETSSLENLCNTFGMWSDSGGPTEEGKLKKVILSEKFDTSKVVNMYALFANNLRIEDYSFLRFFDTSNVTEMSQFFQNNYNLSNLQYLKDWDVSKVTGFQWMFQSVSSLEDASAINNWNISPNANYSNMFKNTPTHSEFTKVQGTWSGGSFTPTP